MKNNYMKIVIGIVCCVLTLSIVLQLRTMKEQSSTVSPTFANDELKDSLLKWKEKYEKSEQLLEESATELQNARANATNNDGASQEKTEQLKNKNMLLGLTNVTGDGIIITAKDGQTVVATDDISKNLVHDGDLREIISELTNAGAEAISVNDQRIVSSTCIMCAGNVISINGERVSSPFVIKAIGNQATLYGINRPGGYLQLMKESTIVDIKKSSNIEIKKFSGVLTQKYMKTK